jgi:ammonia channel protein AmtB
MYAYQRGTILVAVTVVILLTFLVLALMIWAHQVPVDCIDAVDFCG